MGWLNPKSQKPEWAEEEDETLKPEWAEEEDETLYVLTVADLAVAVDDGLGKGDGFWDTLTQDQKREVIIRAEKNIESMMGNSDGALELEEAFEDWKEERKQGGGTERRTP